MKKIHFILFILNLLLFIPAVYMVLGLPLVFAQNGWSGSMIGLFLLASIPSLLKFFLSYPLERFRSSQAHYVRWACILMALLVVFLLLLALPAVASNRLWLFILMLLANLFIAWAEIPINTLAIQILPEEERLRAGGLRSTAMSLSAVFGGGVLLLIQQKYGWSLPFLLMAASLILAIICLFSLAKEEQTSAPKEIAVFTLADMLSIFNQGYRVWIWPLFLWFAVLASIWTFLKPLLFAYGLPAEQVAIIVGLGGGMVSALAGLLAPKLLQHFKKSTSIKVVALVDLIFLFIFTVLIWAKLNVYILATASLLIALALGLTSAAIFRLMMDFVHAQGQAAYYGMQSAIFQSGRIILSVMAGIIIDRIDYTGLMLLIVCLMAAIYLYLSRHQIELQKLFVLTRKEEANARK